MAFIGMRHVVVAKVASHTDGSEPTYTAGMVAGKAISGNLTITRNNNPLYADDDIAEDDNGITEMTLDIGIDDLLEDVQAYMGMLKSKTTGTGTATVTTYYDTSAPAEDVGVGYIRVRRKNRNTVYQAIWAYSGVFGINNESAQTKGRSIEWQTPVANGRFKGLVIDDSGDTVYRKRQNFDSYAAAEEYLDGLAGIST